MGKPDLHDDLLYLIVIGPGTGESTVLRIPGSDDQESVWCVIDSCSIAGKNPACRLLEEHDAQLSLLALSHPHDDHAARFPELKQKLAPNARVAAAWPRLAEESWDGSLDARKRHLKGSAEAAVAAILASWQSEASRCWNMTRGEHKTIGGCDIHVLNPNTSAYQDHFPSNVNRLSTGLLIEWHDCRLLIGGDVEREDWEAIQAAGHSVLHHGCKIPHHGGTSALHPEWLQGNASRGWCLTPWKAGKLPWGSGGDVDELLKHCDTIHLTSDRGTPDSPTACTVQRHKAAVPAPSEETLGGVPLTSLEQPHDEWANHIALGFDREGAIRDRQFGWGTASLRSECRAGEGRT